MGSVLSRREVAKFVSGGFVMLRRGFDPEVAAAGRAFIWTKLGLDPNDPASWHEPFIHIQENFTGEPFSRVMNPRLRGALDQLLGPERWVSPDAFGWWPVLFPGFAADAELSDLGWHVDGYHFHHHLTSPEQGLVTLFLFSDVKSGDGGTAISVGSHRSVAKLMAASQPSGLTYEEVLERVPQPDPERVIEVQGEAGDVALMHPFLVHSINANRGERVRIACNPLFSLMAPMQLDRALHELSAVEIAIARALELPART